MLELDDRNEGGNSIILEKIAHIERLPELVNDAASANKTRFSEFFSNLYLLPFITSQMVWAAFIFSLIKY